MVAYGEPSRDLKGLDSLHADVLALSPPLITHVTILHKLVGDLEKHRTSPH